MAGEVREVFRQRKDGLQERRSWPLKDTTWELLCPGARGALKQATIVKGQRRDLLFYHQVHAPCPPSLPAAARPHKLLLLRCPQQNSGCAVVDNQSTPISAADIAAIAQGTEIPVCLCVCFHKRILALLLLPAFSCHICHATADLRCRLNDKSFCHMPKTSKQANDMTRAS